MDNVTFCQHAYYSYYWQANMGAKTNFFFSYVILIMKILYTA
jgi:hypothetical protein